MTYSLRSMISLMQKMFGDDFWENAILEATHWNYHPKNTQLRLASIPPITEQWWQNQFNELFAAEYGLQVPILPNTICPFLHIHICSIFSYKFVKKMKPTKIL
jgi:hypothetical protein